MHAVGFAVIHRDPVSIKFGCGIRAARVKRRCFALRHFLHQAIQFRSGGLVEAAGFLKPQDPHRLQQAQRADGVGIGGIFGGFETDCHMALCGQVVDFVRLHVLHDADQVGRISQVTVMQVEAPVIDVGILVDILDPASIETGRAPLKAVHLIAIFQQQVCQIGPVLPGYPGNQCALAFASGGHSGSLVTSLGA